MHGPVIHRFLKTKNDLTCKIHTYIYIDIHKYTCAHAYRNTDIYRYTFNPFQLYTLCPILYTHYARTPTCTHANVHERTDAQHIHTHTRTRTHTSTHAHTHTHTHTHTQRYLTKASGFSMGCHVGACISIIYVCVRARSGK